MEPDRSIEGWQGSYRGLSSRTCFQGCDYTRTAAETDEITPRSRKSRSEGTGYERVMSQKNVTTSSQITWRKARGHLKTITEHKLYVMKGCFQVGLYRQGLTHDLSKYLPTELLEGFRYYEDGTSSPNNGERRDKGYSEAWMHHKGRNRHHFEYWLDYREPNHFKTSKSASRTGAASTGAAPTVAAADAKTAVSGVADYLQTVQMPRRYVVEMLMDRIAASKNYNKEAYTQHDPLAYFEKGMGHYLMHPQTKKELYGMLRILDERGEKELMRFVREYYLKGYPI